MEVKQIKDSILGAEMPVTPPIAEEFGAFEEIALGDEGEEEGDLYLIEGE